MFYHLVFEKNLVTGTVSSVILQYDPELSWLFDKSQGFKGDVKIFDNELISLEDITSNIDLNGELGRAITCAFAQQTWYCPNGHTSPDDLGGNCGGNYIITFTYLPCGVSGGNGGGTGGGNGGGGGSGSTQTVIFEICDDLALPGEGNSEDCKDQYADYFTPYICEEYVDFTLVNSINNWAPGNLETATALANYLANCYTEDDEDFCAEVDFVEKVIKDSSFKDTNTECIHNKMKSNPNSIYSKMFAHFNGTTGKFLHLKVGNTPSGDWGITRGSDSTAQFYTITTDTDINANGSNLMKYVTLCHEMIHAYMFSTLEEMNLIVFKPNGEPELRVYCQSGIELNTLTVEERFTALICALYASGALTDEWTHELFNSNVFDIEDYRQKLENMLVNEYDWNSENQEFKNNAQSIFGNNWKQEVAKAISWIGLESTSGFLPYRNSYSGLQFIFISSIKTKIQTTNKDC